MRARALHRTLPAVTLAALLVTAGCADTNDSPGAAASDTGSPQSPQTSSSAPAVTPAPTTTAASPTALALTDRLLPTAEVPGLTASWQWQDGETGPATSDPFGVCAKADLVSIGASDVVARTYFPPDDSDDSAAEQVADFPDARTAATAWTVLKAWHDRCAGAMDANAGLEVGPLQPAPVVAGTGRWYLLSWHPPGEETGRFEGFGMILNGTRIAVLRMDHSGREHTYAAGKDPMAGMVAAAASRLR
jgi:hypothetical protein